MSKHFLFDGIRSLWSFCLTSKPSERFVCLPLLGSGRAALLVCKRSKDFTRRKSNDSEGPETLRRTRFLARPGHGPLAPTPGQTRSAVAKTMDCARKTNEYSFDFLAQNNDFDDFEVKLPLTSCWTFRCPKQLNTEWFKNLVHIRLTCHILFNELEFV